MKRLFIAVKIDPSERLLEKYQQLKQGLIHDKITWVQPDKMHITLKFFGDTFEERMPEIISVMERVAKDYGPLHFHIRGAGIFGSRYKPRVIWLGIPDGEPLSLLGTALIGALEKEGWESDRQNFVPHLTVGRIKYIQDKKFFQQKLDDFGTEDLQSVEIGEMILYESKLKPRGPEYSVIRRVKLEG